MKCKICGDKIPPSRWDRKDRPRQVCSLGCRQSLNGKQGGMPRGTRGSAHPRYKTGRIKNRDGYWRVLAGDHPFPRKYHYVFEHVKVMEEAIGRRIAPNECVHHKNRNRTDNRLENLELMTKSAHSKLRGSRSARA